MQSNEQIESEKQNCSINLMASLDRLTRYVWCQDANIIKLAIERISELEAAVRNLQADRQWQPIETAPRDGTPFLWTNEGHFAAVNWPEYDGCFSSGSWMPLPPPPEEDKQQPHTNQFVYWISGKTKHKK